MMKSCRCNTCGKVVLRDSHGWKLQRVPAMSLLELPFLLVDQTGLYVMGSRMLAVEQGHNFALCRILHTTYQT